jgi:hypothetical protein
LGDALSVHFLAVGFNREPLATVDLPDPLTCQSLMIVSDPPDPAPCHGST